jgi:ATP synthase protein I
VTALRRPDNAARPGKENAGPANSDSRQGSSRSDENEGWAVFSYLIAGMAAYGGIGWLAGHFAHLAFLFPVGMLLGLVLGIVLILYRYGKA